MSPGTTPDPFAEPIRFGQRMQILREGRGMSRPVLAGLVGKSPSWVKQVETGKLHVPKLPVILRIAEVLRVRDLADLTGDQSMSVDMFIGPGHAKLPAVRHAINLFTLPGEREAPALEHLRARLDRAWSARHSAPNHRDVVGGLLPGLLVDAQLTARQADTGEQRRTAQALLAEVYGLSQFFLAYQPDSSLLWRIAERGMVAAQESGDPHAIGTAAWLLAQAHRDAGPRNFDAADEVNRAAVEHLRPLLPDADDRVLAIAGALDFELGYTAARRGESGTAWAHWDEARRKARRLPAGFYHPITSFGQAIMGAHALTIAVELHAGGESVRQAAKADAVTIPSRPRRARHRIEEARGYQIAGQTETALTTLERAYEAAPETIRYNGYARRIVLEETEARSPKRRQRAGRLAGKIGLLAA